MAKILVADDNSNIQKMVGLALKDQGIDVVAVGNGEAAVRKISDVRPDLVLADVFMPVRNGYEVCNYVKQDSALSHIPVILLVGAFDPLDEQEAQRVGADGVLKKPFVPPDPLISMVKSALTRAGVVIGSAEPAVAPPPPPLASSPAPPLPKVAPPPPPPVAEPEVDLGVPVFSSRPAPVAIDKAEQPVAFGNLLNSATQEEEPAFMTPAGGPTAPERDWGHTDQEEAEAEEEEAAPAWRSNSIDESANETPAGQTDWREAAFAGIGGEKSQQPWAPSVEKNSLAITEEEAAELAKAQPPYSSETTTRQPEDWSKAINAIFDSPDKPQAAQPAPEPEPPMRPVVEKALDYIAEPPVSAAVESLAAQAEPASNGTEPRSVENSWMAGALSPWEAELKRASELTSTWDTAQSSPEPVQHEAPPVVPFLNSGLVATAHEHVVEAIEEAKAEQPVPTDAGDSENESLPALGDLLSPATPEASPIGLAPLPDSNFDSEPLASVGTASEPALATEPAQADMDELVAKVLAKMNPDVLQAVTREILKPVVEALVKDELSKK